VSQQSNLQLRPRWATDNVPTRVTALGEILVRELAVLALPGLSLLGVLAGG
jgi:hypothetical protein